MKTHRSKCPTVRYRNNQLFYSFTLIRNTKHIILETFTKTTSLENVRKVSMWTLWARDPKIFITAFLLKTICIWIFLKYCRLLSLKKKKETFQKKIQATLKLLDIARYKRKALKKRERKAKKEKNSNNNNKCFFTFFCEKIYLENLFYIFCIYITVFLCGGYWK